MELTANLYVEIFHNFLREGSRIKNGISLLYFAYDENLTKITILPKKRGGFMQIAAYYNDNDYLIIFYLFLSTFSFLAFMWSPWLPICIAGFQPSLCSFSFIGLRLLEKDHREKRAK